jgi:hypothetical protein
MMNPLVDPPATLEKINGYTYATITFKNAELTPNPTNPNMKVPVDVAVISEVRTKEADDSIIWATEVSRTDGVYTVKVRVPDGIALPALIMKNGNNDTSARLKLTDVVWVNKAALKANIAEAKAIGKGNHHDVDWNALQGAIADAETVDNQANATQNAVDAAAQLLRVAIMAFNNSNSGGGSSGLDKDNLADGVYTLHADMIKSTDHASYSMVNNAIDHDVTLTVSGGNYSIAVEFKGLTINLGGQDFFGYLSRLKYYDAGYTFDNYGEPQGALIPAAVLSYQKDVNGDNIVDYYNDADNPYPKTLSFPLVNKANYADNDVPLQVFVPIMEGIAAGTGTQNVLMRLDWSTLKEGSGGGSGSGTVDKSALVAKIAEAEALSSEDYTVESFAVLTSALAAAKAVNADANATQLQVNTQVTALSITINSLEPKDGQAVGKIALASKLAQARAVVNNNYTDVSWSILQTAISVAQGVYDSQYSTQTEVNEQVATLTNAINGLTKRPANTIDKNALPDGKYELRVDLWHATLDKASMGNGALNHTALLEVIGGKYYLSVSGHPMQIGNITASLRYLQIRQANGSYVNADVIAWNIAGGKPSAFRFALPSKDTYIAVKVDPQIEVMGNDPVAARLRLSWDTLVKVSDNATVSSNVATTVGSAGTGTPSPAANIVDEATGVKVEADANILPTGTTASVAPITSGNAYNKAKDALKGIGTNFVLFDITLKGPNGEAIQPTAPVKVTLPIPANIDKDLAEVYRINDDGSKTLMKSTIEGDYIVFYTDHFSLYVIVEREAEKVATTSGSGSTGITSPETPLADGSTGGFAIYWLLIPIALIALGIAAFIVRRKITQAQ